MTAVVVHGPYEHTGAYQESELFDTSGVPDEFCPTCEHAPCISGFYRDWCALTPRYLTNWGVHRELMKLVDEHIPDWQSPVSVALRTAISHLGTLAAYRDGQLAYEGLVKILTALRAAPEDES